MRLVKKKKPAAIYEQGLKTWNKQVEFEYQSLKKIYDAQDSLTKEVIDRVQHRLLIGAPRLVRVSDRDIPVEKEVTEKNAFRAAVKIIHDLASYDVRVANYKIPGGFCRTCARPLSSRRKHL